MLKYTFRSLSYIRSLRTEVKSVFSYVRNMKGDVEGILSDNRHNSTDESILII
jgi:hypothetical protein